MTCPVVPIHRTADQSGEENPRAVVTEIQVREIVGLIRAGWANTKIAKRFGIGHAAVSCIRRGKSWRNVTAAMGYQPILGKTAPKSGRTKPRDR